MLTTTPTSIQLLMHPQRWAERLIQEGEAREYSPTDLPEVNLRREVHTVKEIVLFDRRVCLSQPFTDGTVMVFGIKPHETEALGTRPISSGEERLLDTQEDAGSNPASVTIWVASGQGGWFPARYSTRSECTTSGSLLVLAHDSAGLRFQGGASCLSSGRKKTLGTPLVSGVRFLGR